MNIFNFKHPKDVNLNYFNHLKFSWCESIRAFGMCLVMFVHGIIPYIFDNTFSNYIKKAKERVEVVTEKEK